MTRPPEYTRWANPEALATLYRLLRVAGAVTDAHRAGHVPQLYAGLDQLDAAFRACDQALQPERSEG